MQYIADKSSVHWSFWPVLENFGMPWYFGQVLILFSFSICCHQISLFIWCHRLTALETQQVPALFATPLNLYLHKQIRRQRFYNIPIFSYHSWIFILNKDYDSFMGLLCNYVYIENNRNQPKLLWIKCKTVNYWNLISWFSEDLFITTRKAPI